MFETVALPVWALLLILGFAAVAAVDRVLGPGLRWFLRRRMERAVARLNARLDRPIEPFKLLERQDTVNRVLYSPEVMQAVQEHARTEGIPEEVVFAKARRYAREIVPGFSTAAYFGFATRVARLLSRAFYRVRLGAYDEKAISAIDHEATVIFVMNHRSNMDYVLVTYLVAERSALAYAVGEWARVWPLRSLVRALGGYFIRRRSRNPLYRRVLSRYVQLSAANGVTQAMFPEGGLSLDGRVGPAKLGLLSYVLQGFDPARDRDVVFVPIGINYDRVIEDRVLVKAQDTGTRAFRVSIRRALWVAARHLLQRVSGRFHRFGYAAVSFGAPVSLRTVMAENGGRIDVGHLGDLLTGRVRDIVPVLPVPLVAAVLAGAEGPMPRAAIVAEAGRLRTALAAQGAHVHLPRDDPDYEVTVGLRGLVARGVLRETAEGYEVGPGEDALLRFYANSVLQLVHRDRAPSAAT